MMDKKEALRILGIEQGYDKSILKKKYRELMHLVHPDNGEMAHKNYEYSAQEINEAYSKLNSVSSNEPEELTTKGENKRKSETRGSHSSKKKWHAPINNQALFKRKIYDEVRDVDGNVIGFIEIAEDKYLWNIEEEFHLFLKSIFVLSKQLLDEVDSKLSRETKSDYIKYQAELTYLLAGQFIDSLGALFALNLDIETEDEETVFYIPAMLEEELFAKITDDNIYPLGVSNHRLYVCDINRRKLGYLSFKDDRYSFILTPLFEQKSIKIKMKLCVKKTVKKKKAKTYREVDLWIKVPVKQNQTYIDSVNLKIADILNKYEMSQ